MDSVLVMVYALLEAMLANLPGILRVSRKILNVGFAAALLIALLTARPEYFASSLSASAVSANRALSVVFVLERVISMAAVLILLAMLAFILWFPVQMPRNLAIFSIGFVAFFAVRVALLLIHTYWANADSRVLSDITSFALAGCCAYWLVLINPDGEKKPVRMGHSWGPIEQRRLMGQLEAMNDALLRAARR
jgi:Ca2+/Na+ antiporter